VFFVLGSTNERAPSKSTARIPLWQGSYRFI
jgi:hypothetical protein